MLYKDKRFFGGKMSIKGAVAYMLTSDFKLELTKKYVKNYQGEEGFEGYVKYSDILNHNIINERVENLQIRYLPKEGGVYKGKNLVKAYIQMKGLNLDLEDLQKIYLQESTLCGLE